MSVQRLDDAALSLLGIVPRAGRTGPKIEPIPLSISVPLIFNLSSASKRQARCARAVGYFGDYVSSSGRKSSWGSRPTRSCGQGCCAHGASHSELQGRLGLGERRTSATADDGSKVLIILS
jgi:hypothetical protein